MIIFISGIGTGIGKSFVNMRINALLMERGYNIISIKPIETGIKSNSNESLLQDSAVTVNNSDAALHAQNQSELKDISEICFYQFALPAAPFVADSQGIIDIDFLKRKIKSLEKECDILLVEGAGGLFVPIKRDYFFIDLIKDLAHESRLLCLLISSDKLGCIDAILSHREALERRNISFISIVNLFDKAQFMCVSYPFLRHLERNFILQLEEREILEFITRFIKS